MSKTLADLTLREVPVVEPQTALDEVIRLADEDPLNTVVLVGDEMFFGVFDDRSRDSGLVPHGADLSTLEVGPYIHPPRLIASPETPVADALAMMRRRAVSLLPVVRNRTYLGIVTLADVEAAG